MTFSSAVCDEHFVKMTILSFSVGPFRGPLNPYGSSHILITKHYVAQHSALYQNHQSIAEQHAVQTRLATM